MLSLRIAGVPLSLRGDGLPPGLARRYGPFAAPPEPTGWTVELTPGRASDPDAPPGRAVARGGLIVLEGRGRLGGVLDPGARRGAAIAEPTGLAVDALVRAALAEIHPRKT